MELELDLEVVCTMYNANRIIDSSKMRLISEICNRILSKSDKKTTNVLEILIAFSDFN